MSASQKTVYVPDRSTPYYFPDTMTNEEIRGSLVATGHAGLSSAQVVEEAGGKTIRFQRVTGGSKGTN